MWEWAFGHKGIIKKIRHGVSAFQDRAGAAPAPQLVQALRVELESDCIRLWLAS
jgi:hypothetical protein